MTSIRRVAARAQLPRAAAHPGSQAAGTGEVLTCSAPGECGSPSTWSLGLLGPGRAQNAGTEHRPNCVCAWDPEPERRRPGKCTQPRARLRQFPGRATWSLSRDWESAHAMSGANPAWPRPCAHSRTRQWGLSAVFLPPHSTNEQVSLSKWLPSPPCIRAKVRYWKDYKTEKAKINKEDGTPLEVTGATDENPAVSTGYVGKAR